MQLCRFTLLAVTGSLCAIRLIGVIAFAHRITPFPGLHSHIGQLSLTRKFSLSFESGLWV